MAKDWVLDIFIPSDSRIGCSVNIYQMVFIGILLIALVAFVVFYFLVIRRDAPNAMSAYYEMRRQSSLSDNTDLEISTALDEPILVNGDLLHICSPEKS